MIGLATAVVLSQAWAQAAPRIEPGSPARTQRRLLMMGTEVTVDIEADDRGAALAASERAVRALEATEARLSTWRDGSEVARLNRAAPGERVELSPATAADLAAARRCWVETGGAFDPTVGALAAAWGLRDGGRVPGDAERRRALAATGMEHLDLRFEQAAVARGGGGAAGDEAGGEGALGAAAARRLGGLRLDEGGFGKGAGLDRAVAALAGPEVERAWIDLGGQVMGWSATRRGADWVVALADPDDRLRPVVALAVDGGSVATSGTSERGNHLLDPRSGGPAPSFGSVTVWTAEALRADCLSTGLYVLGPQAALAWASAHSGVEVLVLSRDRDRLTARATPRMAARLTALVQEVEIEVVSGALNRQRHEPPGE